MSSTPQRNVMFRAAADADRCVQRLRASPGLLPARGVRNSRLSAASFRPSRRSCSSSLSGCETMQRERELRSPHWAVAGCRRSSGSGRLARMLGHASRTVKDVHKGLSVYELSEMKKLYLTRIPHHLYLSLLCSHWWTCAFTLVLGSLLCY